MNRAALLLVSSLVACSSPSTSDLFASPTESGGTAGASSGGDPTGTGTSGSTGMAGDSIDVGGTSGVGGSTGGAGGAAGANGGDGGSGPGGSGGSGQTGGSGMSGASVADGSDAGRTAQPDARVRDTGTEATDGPSKDGGRLTCDPDTFPGFDDGCTNSQSCSFGFHQVDCCGTLVAIGFNHALVDSFDKAEASWRAACPANCGCPPGPTRTDNGDTGDKSDVAVRCEGQSGSFGSCVTYFP